MRTTSVRAPKRIKDGRCRLPNPVIRYGNRETQAHPLIFLQHERHVLAKENFTSDLPRTSPGCPTRAVLCFSSGPPCGYSRTLVEGCTFRHAFQLPFRIDNGGSVRAAIPSSIEKHRRTDPPPRLLGKKVGGRFGFWVDLESKRCPNRLSHSEFLTGLDNSTGGLLMSSEEDPRS